VAKDKGKQRNSRIIVEISKCDFPDTGVGVGVGVGLGAIGAVGGGVVVVCSLGKVARKHVGSTSESVEGEATQKDWFEKRMLIEMSEKLQGFVVGKRPVVPRDSGRKVDH